MAYPNDMFPPPTDGDFLSQKNVPSFANLAELTPVGSENIRKSKRTFNGLGHIIGVKTHYHGTVDERTYDVLRLEPTDDCDRVGRAVDTSPAFATNHDTGLFYNIAVTAMKAGFSVNIMSPETDWKPCPPLAVTAFNYIAMGDKLEILHADPDTEITTPASRNKLGVSRSLVDIIKQLELLYAYGRGPEDIEGIGGVYHKKSTMREDVDRYTRAIPLDVAPGVLSAIKNPLRIPELMQTAITAPQQIYHAATSIVPLRHANVGESLLNIHPRTSGTITLLNQDIFGDQDEHEKSYSSYKGITVRRVDGGHTNFISTPEQHALKQRIYTKARQQRSGSQLSSV